MTLGDQGWLAGAASRPFPIPPGTPMAGYMARTGPATGTHDELTISALTLRAGDGEVVIVAADLAGVDAALVGEIAAAAGIASNRLILCASHTHSGPAGVTARLHPADDDRSDPALRTRFVSLCTSAIADARDRLETVSLVYGTAESHGVAANRNDPDGPFDPQVSVIAARSLAGSERAVLVHFACHPTILGAESRVISSEFPGALRRSLRASLEETGATSEILYANGAAGDVSTRFTRRAQDAVEVDRVGTALAEASRVALESAWPLAPLIRSASTTDPLPPRTLAETETSSVDEIGVALDANPAAQRLTVTRAQGAALLSRLAAAGAEAIPASLTLGAWSLGELVLVAVPGELFASLGARIVSASPGPVLVLGYANGYAGYLADRAAYDSGTYEALASPYAPGAGEQVAQAAIDLVTRVRGQQGRIHGE